MSFHEHPAITDASVSPVVEERSETLASGSETGSPPQDPPPTEPVTNDIDGDAANAVPLCRHVKEDGIYCHTPALSGRPYCYRHLRLRGQQMRMARAVAQRLSYQLVLPPLDDMNAVQSALTHVAAALTAGLLERRRAGQLLYALQQAANNLRFLARAQAPSKATLAPDANQPEAGRQRVVKEYPEFEAEFGLPPGLDLTLPPQVAFPPPAKATGWAALQTTPQASSHHVWTKEDIQLEELDKQRPYLSEKSYCEQSSAIHDKFRKRVVVELRKEREADWEAEAARRNAKEAEKAELWRSMDVGQQRAFMQGVMTGREEAEEQRRQEELAGTKKPTAKASGGDAASESKSPETGAAK